MANNTTSRNGTTTTTTTTQANGQVTTTTAKALKYTAADIIKTSRVMTIKNCIAALNLGLGSDTTDTTNEALKATLGIIGRAKFGVECITYANVDKSALVVTKAATKAQAEADTTLSDAVAEAMIAATDAAKVAKGGKYYAAAKVNLAKVEAINEYITTTNAKAAERAEKAAERAEKAKAAVIDYLVGQGMTKDQAAAKSETTAIIKGRKDAEGRYLFSPNALVLSMDYTYNDVLTAARDLAAVEAHNAAVDTAKANLATLADAAKEASDNVTNAEVAVTNAQCRLEAMTTNAATAAQALAEAIKGSDVEKIKAAKAADRAAKADARKATTIHNAAVKVLNKAKDVEANAINLFKAAQALAAEGNTTTTTRRRPTMTTATTATAVQA